MTVHDETTRRIDDTVPPHRTTTDDTPSRITRRRMLSLTASGALASLVAAACSDDTASPGTSGTAAPSAESSSADGASETADTGATTGTGESDATGSSSAAGEEAVVTPDCVLAPEQAEGPFYTDVRLARRDITEGRPGSPLELRFVVVDAETCTPIPDAVVDVWHADAGGLYSSFQGQGDEANIDTTAETFLRGIQTTNDKGVATFTTLYPGWYPGRTTHVHVKVHLADATLVTTQVYFPDDVSTAVYGEHPAYTERGPKDTTNEGDGVGGDEQALLTRVDVSGDGHVATSTLGIARA